MAMTDEMKQLVEQAIADIEGEYKKDNGDLFIFLFSYFYPRIDTKSDYITDAQGRYHCICIFKSSGKGSARRHMLLFARYFGIGTKGSSFSAYIDVHSISISNKCTEEEYGDHFSFYGNESDYYYMPVKTALALADAGVRTVVEEEQGSEYVLVTKVMEMLEAHMSGSDIIHPSAAFMGDPKISYAEEDRQASILYNDGVLFETMDDLGYAIEVWQKAYAIWTDIQEINPDFRSKEYDELTDKISDLLETEIDGYD